MQKLVGMRENVRVTCRSFRGALALALRLARLGGDAVPLFFLFLLGLLGLLLRELVLQTSNDQLSAGSTRLRCCALRCTRTWSPSTAPSGPT